ncbi:hypothetical protein M2152_001372 [Microbacteriaceae bacterium SG_E_30_P1]|uniref:Uncharacterized protein n=1 Tax=Antiquaquibacter oligotrophicus TaxID=2880260 RepID=A0ABT6KMG6_9MICO|nr:hypothetical protein [Antiquaquibacter oligotrophicus]MDH6181190.1 hypothetical protein [Antiquaquibacter oligotrophicus]UDF13115.1 hypothetical protein LH407_13280 [Antiquaquibacter oligotrophicus]
MRELPETSIESGRDAAYPAPDFDVREFARTAHGSFRSDLELGLFREAPLSSDTLRALAYLQVIERATMTHLRSVLVTATHKDARITAFLVTWAYEKYWIADALQQILLAHQPEGATSDAVFRTPVERTIRESIVANIIGVPMIAVHMSLGTVDEWLTQTAYARLSAVENRPELTVVTDQFRQVKARQLEFFEAQARFRLTESPRARSLTRRRLAKTPWPIGAKAEPEAETRFFFDYLFDSREVVDDLDSRIDSLPGQSGLGLIRKATRR